MNETVLITGASSGIGAEFAKQYAKKRKNLVLVARSKDKLQKLATDLESKYSVKVDVIIADLSTEFAAQTVYDEVQKRNIFIQILVNNAGFNTSGLLTSSDIRKQHQEVMVNVTTLSEMTYLFLKDMLQHNSGTIINVASIISFFPGPYSAIYGATKAFVLSFTEALYVEYKEKGIKFLAICPGPTDTGFFDEGGIAVGKKRLPSDVVQSAFKGLEKDRIYYVDGLNNYFNTILPRFFPRKLTANIIGSMSLKELKKSGAIK